MSLQQIPGHYIISASATGGGGSNCVYSTAVSATATASGQAFFTATQVPVSAYDQGSIITSTATGTMGGHDAWIYRFDYSSLLASQTLTDLAVTFPNYNYNPSQMSVYLGVSLDPGATSYGAYVELSSDLYAPGSHTISASDVQRIANGQTSFGSSMAILLLGWWGNYMSIQPTADMSGMSVTGTSLPYPDRPAYETASASLSASGSEWVAPSGTGWISTATAKGTAEYSNGSSMTASSQDTGVVGCSNDVLNSAMNWAVKNSAAYDPVDYPSTAYSFANETANFTYGASGLVG